MLNKKLLGLAFMAATLASAAYAAVPNVFVAGTPAKAAEVNDNFEYLDNKVSALEAKSGVKHNIIYNPVTVEPGTEVIIDSESYRLFKFPYFDQHSGKTYHVSLLSTSTPEDFSYEVWDKTSGGTSLWTKDKMKQVDIGGYTAYIEENCFLSVSSSESYGYCDVWSVYLEIADRYLEVHFGSVDQEVLVFSSASVTDYDLTDEQTLSNFTAYKTGPIIDQFIDYMSVTEIVQ
ncbi:MAG: hypothetical protein HRU20_25230 [Pseudomonadales bacterium]|nr:hypothetical protein [Pseudomonadales bacterium]